MNNYVWICPPNPPIVKMVHITAVNENMFISSNKLKKKSISEKHNLVIAGLHTANMILGNLTTGRCLKQTPLEQLMQRSQLYTNK
jgi:hypothetical protein